MNFARIENMVEDGETLFNQGDWNEAEETLQNVILACDRRMNLTCMKSGDIRLLGYKIAATDLLASICKNVRRLEDAERFAQLSREMRFFHNGHEAYLHEFCDRP